MFICYYYRNLFRNEYLTIIWNYFNIYFLQNNPNIKHALHCFLNYHAQLLCMSASPRLAFIKLTPCIYSFSLEYHFKKTCCVCRVLMIKHTLWELISDHSTYWILILTLQWYMETFIYWKCFASNILINRNILYGSINTRKVFSKYDKIRYMSPNIVLQYDFCLLWFML